MVDSAKLQVQTCSQNVVIYLDNWFTTYYLKCVGWVLLTTGKHRVRDKIFVAFIERTADVYKRQDI